MNLSDLGKMKEMMGQAKQMQEQMERKLAETVVEASSGGGVVTVRMNGKKEAAAHPDRALGDRQRGQRPGAAGGFDRRCVQRSRAEGG